MPKLIDDTNAQEIAAAFDAYMQAEEEFKAARDAFWDAISKHNGRLLDSWTLWSIGKEAKRYCETNVRVE